MSSSSNTVNQINGAKRYVVLLKVAGSWRKMFSIQYERSQGKLGYYVQLPYFRHTRAVLSNFRNTSRPGESSQMDLTRQGITTTERVKYTHHQNGEAHFSQDGKVLTKIRTETFPLDQYAGHLFTVHFFGASSFELAKDGDTGKGSKDRESVFLTYPNQQLSEEEIAGRFVGVKREIRNVAIDDASLSAQDFRNPVRFKIGDSPEQIGVFLFPPNPEPNDFCISISLIPMQRTSPDDAESLLLLGGFHAPLPAEDPDSYVTGIAINYTDGREGWEALEEQLGTIDFDRYQMATSDKVAIEAP